MPHPRRTALAALAALALALPARPGPLFDRDRQQLLAHLEMTEAWLRDEVASLSPAQLAYRPTPEAWSVSDVVEHLSIAEPQYWQWIQESMQKPETAETMKASDAAVLWYGIDRTSRARTAEARDPKGKGVEFRTAYEGFLALRATMREYARGTQADLRRHRFQTSEMDVYQWFLMISTHSQRHILQIREIKRSAGFPKR